MLGHSGGFLMQYTTIPARCVIALPDAVSWDEAACIQPLAIAVHASLSAAIPSSP
jgi:threonine dehydrogenase-like Zn-dependent dehydrogenase